MRTVTCADSEKSKLNKLIAAALDEFERHIIKYLISALVDCNRAESLTRSVVNKSLNSIFAVVQKLGDDAADRL